MTNSIHINQIEKTNRMITIKDKDAIKLKVEIGSNDPKHLTEDQIGRLKTFAKNNTSGILIALSHPLCRLFPFSIRKS